MSEIVNESADEREEVAAETETLAPGDPLDLVQVVEALLLAAGGPLSIEQIQASFGNHEQPDRKAVRDALKALDTQLSGRAVELLEVASGWRIQVRQDFAGHVARLWEERPPRFTRALLETLALIVYRQPISRGEIEEIRGVSLSPNIIKTLMEREWVKVVGVREAPGRPELLGTTKQFLDDFNLKHLDQLPSLPEIRDLDSLGEALERLQTETGNDEEDADSGENSAEEVAEAVEETQVPAKVDETSDEDSQPEDAELEPASST